MKGKHFCQCIRIFIDGESGSGNNKYQQKNRKEILRKKEIRLKKLGIIGYGLRSETMMKAFQGIQAPVQVAAVADPLWCQKQEAFAQTAEFAQTVFYETAEEMLEKKG